MNLFFLFDQILLHLCDNLDPDYFDGNGTVCDKQKRAFYTHIHITEMLLLSKKDLCKFIGIW